jgi:hypothetical protein
MSDSLDFIKVTGRLNVELRDELGNIKASFEVPNIVTTVGKTFIAAAMAKTTVNTPAAMTHMAVGTSSTAATVADTTLGAEVAGSRTTLTSTTPSSNTCVYACTFGAGVGTGTLWEAGIFNASSAGTLLCRTVFGASIAKGASDSLTITWTITIN